MWSYPIVNDPWQTCLLLDSLWSLLLPTSTHPSLVMWWQGQGVFRAVSCYHDILTTTSPAIPRTRPRASAPLLQWPRRGHLLSRKNVYFRIQSVLAHWKEPWSKSAISIMCGPFQYLDIPEPSPRYEGCSNYPELQPASLSAAHHTSAALQCMQSHAHHLYCTAET